MIGINAGSSGTNSGNHRSAPNERKELSEIMGIIEAARERLDDIIIRYDARGKDTTELDKAEDALNEAFDALDEAADSLEDAWGE